MNSHSPVDGYEMLLSKTESIHPDNADLRFEVRVDERKDGRKYVVIDRTQEKMLYQTALDHLDTDHDIQREKAIGFRTGYKQRHDIEEEP